MPFNSIFSWIIKKRIEQINQFIHHPMDTQYSIFHNLIADAANTEWGIKYGYSSIKTYQDYKSRVPLSFYEDIHPYIQRTIEGEKNILWKSPIQWFSKSSGTTNDISKYIPVSKESLYDCHYKGGKDLLGVYYHNHPEAKLFSGKHLIIGGNTSINQFNKDTYFADLSAIIVKNLPIWAEIRRTPSRKIALLPDWEEKIQKMAESCSKEDVRVLAGVPSWMLVLLKRILEINQASSIKEIWPKLEMYMHGGVNFEPYRNQFESIIGEKINYYQTYNASEGFFGLQYEANEDDMLLMLDYGIFYEFIPMNQYNGVDSSTVSLENVELGQNYAMVISTNAGLWRYIVGDTVEFTSLNPFKIRVTGRTKHFINAFGEELIIDNAETAIKILDDKFGWAINDFTAAPIYFNDGTSGGHEWLIEFENEEIDVEQYSLELDKELRKLNSDYNAKRFNDMTLRKPLVRSIQKGTFHEWMKVKNKLGGQSKVPRLANDRKFIEEVLKFITYDQEV